MKKILKRLFAFALFAFALLSAFAQNDTNSIEKALEQGDPNAQHLLGLSYFMGIGVNQDLKEAVYWYRKAAEQGHVYAQYMLGLCYNRGYGVNQDFKEAVYWYRKAAEQGDPDAQYNLGVCYHNGVGVNKDLKEAVNWYRKAAEQGNAKAKNALENLNVKEISSPKTSKKQLPLPSKEERNARLKQLKESLQKSDSITRKAKAKAYDGRRLISSGEAKANRRDYIAAEGTAMARFVSMEQTRQNGREEIERGEALIRESEEELAKIDEIIEEIEYITETFELTNKKGQTLSCRLLEIDKGQLFVFANGRVYGIPLHTLTDESRATAEKELNDL